MHHREHWINLPDGRRYPIYLAESMINQIGTYLRDEVESSQRIIVTDSHVAAHWLSHFETILDDSGITHHSIILPAGESTKSFAMVENLLNQLLELQPDRKTMLIALGGGVVGDITGFAASILLRGVPFIQIPTTLLAQVDSSVGGKTGINSKFGKNLIGSFYQPKAVFIDCDILATLPRRQMRAGYAEIIKVAALANDNFFRWCEQHSDDVLSQDPEHLLHAIEMAVRIKAEIVSRDEREQGVRAYLNLGHTFGHALEAECAYDGRLLHGEAVALGMMMAFGYAHHTGLCDEVSAERMRAHLANTNLPYRPTDIPVTLTAETLVKHMMHDKKNSDKQLNLILPDRIGEVRLQKNVDTNSVLAFLQKWLNT